MTGTIPTHSPQPSRSEASGPSSITPAPSAVASPEAFPHRASSEQSPSTILPPRKHRGRMAAVSAGIAVILGASVALPIGVWLGAREVESPLATTPIISEDIVPVTEGMRRNSTPVTLTRHTTNGVEATTSESGRVTWAPALGSTLDTGDKVAIIDDRTVIGYTAEVPLWRDLARNIKGDDVKQLQQLLTKLGYFKGTADGVYGPGTVAAVTEFNKATNRTSLKGSFSLASVSWLGASPLIIDELVAPTGSAYAGGTALVKGPIQVAWLSIVGGGAELIESGKTQLSLSVLPEPLPVDSVTITDPEVTSQLAPLFNAEGTLPVNLEDIDETPVKSVPASALITSTTGTTCVYDGETKAPVTVNSIGGGNSTITFAQDFPLKLVIANPAQLEGLAPCN